MSVSNPLVGVRRVVAFQFEGDDGKRHNIYDQHPTGFLIVTAEGRMMALVTAGDRPSDASAEVLLNRMTAYSGHYRMQGTDMFVTKVDTAWLPAFLGTEQVRNFTLEGNTLSAFSPPQDHPRFPGKKVRYIAIWEREYALF
jgi:lipocalin-like protein